MSKGAMIGTLFVATAAFFTYAIHWSARRQNDAHERFQPVAARVVSSRVEKVTSRSGSSRTTSYAPRITYAYSVDGVEYTSKRYQFMGAGHTTYDSADAVAERYPKGGSVTAYFDPANPSVAVLDRSPVDMTILNWATVLIWSVIVAMITYFVRRYRQVPARAVSARGPRAAALASH